MYNFNSLFGANMKKIIFSLIMISCVILPVIAVEGFYDETLAPITVSNALNMPDDSLVVLDGKIVKRLSKDKYTFQDKTATVIVEIDNEAWRGLIVKKSDLLRLKGEVDRDFNSFKIDVFNVEKLSN